MLVIYCCMYLPLCVGVLCSSLFQVCITLCPSSFATILTMKRELVALLLLSFRCLVTVNLLVNASITHSTGVKHT